MKLHNQAIENIVHVCTTYGGYKDETKLVAQLNNIRLSLYKGDKPGLVLVSSQTYINERTARGLPTNDIIPMRLHSSVVDKVKQLYEMFSGHIDEKKFRAGVRTLDLTPYERKQGPNEVVLVLTSDYEASLRGTPKP